MGQEQLRLALILSQVPMGEFGPCLCEVLATFVRSVNSQIVRNPEVIQKTGFEEVSPDLYRQVGLPEDLLAIASGSWANCRQSDATAAVPVS